MGRKLQYSWADSSAEGPPHGYMDIRDWPTGQKWAATMALRGKSKALS